ncbi:MAG: large-conductance mechanosensitive channel protein MscL [Pseudoxanthomonas sp.]
MGMITEFKKFAMRGNVIDLAVGVVIGAAFGKIVTSLVADIIMPPIGLLIGNVDFSDLAVTLREATVDAAGQEVPAVVIAYGSFINVVIQFLIVAFAIFALVRAINKLAPKKEEEAKGPTEDVLLLREIRDALKDRPTGTGTLPPG